MPLPGNEPSCRLPELPGADLAPGLDKTTTHDARDWHRPLIVSRGEKGGDCGGVVLTTSRMLCFHRNGAETGTDQAACARADRPAPGRPGDSVGAAAQQRA